MERWGCDERMKQKGEAEYDAASCFMALDVSENGRSRDNIPEGPRFSVPVKTGTVAHPASSAIGTTSLYRR